MKRAKERLKAMVRERAGQETYSWLKATGVSARRALTNAGTALSRIKHRKGGRPAAGFSQRRGVIYAIEAPTLDRVLCQENFEWVCRALDSTSIEWWWVDPARPMARRVIGVRESSRQSVVDALTSAAAKDPDGDAVRVADARRRGRHSPAALGWDKLTHDAGVLMVGRFVTDEAGTRWRGIGYACEIEFWETADDGSVVAPRENRAAAQLDEASSRQVQVERAGVVVKTPAVFENTMIDDIDFPIDVVYTWVDGDDPAWRAKKASFSGQDAVHVESTHDARFRSRDELKYSLRALDDYAPWVRTVFLVTDGQVPDWLDTANPRIRVIDHTEILPAEVLPVFNSNAIISRLHHIPGLSEHFLYFNDDVMLGRHVGPESFFLANGIALVSASNNRRPFGAPSLAVEPHLNLTRNIRNVLQTETGRTPARAIKHTPHPLRKSLLEEQERVFAEAYEATLTHRFRHHDDIVADQLHHYYAQVRGLAAPSRLTYTYINVLDDSYEPVLSDLLARRHRDAFCLNDAPVDGARPIDPTKVQQFMESYFAASSQFEDSCEPD